MIYFKDCVNYDNKHIKLIKNNINKSIEIILDDRFNLVPENVIFRIMIHKILLLFIHRDLIKLYMLYKDINPEYSYINQKQFLKDILGKNIIPRNKSTKIDFRLFGLIIIWMKWNLDINPNKRYIPLLSDIINVIYFGN